MTSYRLIRLQLVLCLFSLVGCSQVGNVDHQPYVIQEDGQQKIVQAVLVWSNLPNAFVVGPSGKTIGLVEKIPSDEKQLSPHYVLNQPPWRQLGAEDSLTALVSNVAASLNASDHVIWIIGTKPLLIAIGTTSTQKFLYLGADIHREGYVRLSGTQRLIRVEDLNEPVSDLIFVNSWPTHVKYYEPAPAYSVSHLPRAESLREAISSVNGHQN